MLVIRNDKFVKLKNELYIIGSSNNDLYRNNVAQMGKVVILAWSVEPSKSDVSRLKKLDHIEGLEVKLYPDNLSILEKVKVIKDEVRKCRCVSLKMTLNDAYIGCHYAIKYKKPFVIESGTYSWGSLVTHGGSIIYKLAAVPFELLAKYYHWRAKYIIYVSRFYLQRYYKSNAKCIGCPDVALNPVEPIVLERRLTKIAEKNGKDEYILGLIGQSNAEYRGHDTLIDVASILVQKGFNIKIRFLGGGRSNDKRIARARALGIEDRVAFEGYMNHDDVLKWLESIDVLVMPTLQETLGRSIIEAMSRACPVVGSTETAIGEQIGSDCLAPARDKAAISSIIEKMIKNKEYMKYCAQENFIRAHKYYSIYTNEEKREFYYDFYRDNKINIF